MKKQLTYIAPLRAGIVLAVLCGILSLIIVPFILLAAVFGGKTGGAVPAVFGVGFAILLPLIYAAQASSAASLRRLCIIWLRGGPVALSLRFVIWHRQLNGVCRATRHPACLLVGSAQFESGSLVAPSVSVAVAHSR